MHRVCRINFGVWLWQHVRRSATWRWENSMIFRQLFEPLSSTYTCLLGCEDSGEAALIDPAMPE